jgi:hypothetical protein
MDRATPQATACPSTRGGYKANHHFSSLFLFLQPTSNHGPSAHPRRQDNLPPQSILLALRPASGKVYGQHIAASHNVCPACSRKRSQGASLSSCLSDHILIGLFFLSAHEGPIKDCLVTICTSKCPTTIIHVFGMFKPCRLKTIRLPLQIATCRRTLVRFFIITADDA